MLQLDFAQVAVLCGVQHRAAKGAAPQRRQLHAAVCGNQQKLYVTKSGGVYRLRRATREAVSQRSDISNGMPAGNGLPQSAPAVAAPQLLP